MNIVLVLDEGFKSTVENELPNINLSVLSAEVDPSAQVSNVETFITQGMDAIIMMPCEYDASSPAVSKSKEAGIPFVNVCTATREKPDSFVGSWDQEASEIAIEYIAKNFDGKAKIAMMTGVIGQSAEIGRTEGAHEAIKNYPDIEIIAEQSGAWLRDEGLKIMENWIQSFGDEIDVLYAQNDEMALGALEAIEAAGLQDKIFIVGVDGIVDGRKAVSDGRMDATILQNGFVQAKGALYTAINIIKGNPYEETIYVPFELITKENIALYNENPYGQSTIKFE